ncbi:DUF4389 domain-containing protein [Polaromonas naphthalenivorans]|uniref:Putative lipase n=1 Tax=Polaromonas naphthalenivorans (strain CJ2) TaxID=365044 RepID=A1VP20_POLNA|nr:DUF4389 domain-containing protein [Polaromonas naphthalenivorans]ABM37398.1 putative lipase [Polaromonas naphthalenivorans CJ2]
MSDEMLKLPPPRTLWVRALLMILLAAAFQLAASVLLFVAVLQLILAATSASNARLQELGRSLGRYLAQIAEFESFGSEALPFPFSAWPPGNSQISL